MPVKSSQVFCSRACSYRLSRGARPADEPVHLVCAHCHAAFLRSRGKYKACKTYCSNACKVKAFRSANPDRDTDHRRRAAEKQRQKAAAERILKGAPVKRGKAQPSAEEIEASKRKERDRATERAKELHRQDARVVCCEECGIQFCPLYGASHTRLCACCKTDRAKAQRASAKLFRRLREKIPGAERVDPYKVFARDRWLCQMCGIATPREKRGSYDHDSPELDHITPISKGGAHSYENTRCLCRSCNGLKSDMSDRELLDWLAS